jgi:hypothetical protein
MARDLRARLRQLIRGSLDRRGPYIPVIRRNEWPAASRYRPLVALAIASTVSVSAGAAPSVRALFVDATQQEQAVRMALADPAASAAVLKSVRHTVTSYEAVVRRYPTSSYSDDALWQAARLALDAFGRFGDVQDRETATRLLRWLAAEYPTSRRAKQVPGLLNATTKAAKDVTTRKPALPGVAAGRTTASEAAGTRSPAPARENGKAKTASITNIRRSLLPDVVRVTIALDTEVEFHDERIAGPPRIFVDFPATQATRSLVDRTLRFEADGDAVRHVRIGRQPNATTRIVIDAAGISSYSVYPVYNPYRLVIDCVRAASSGAPARVAARPKPGPAI